MRKLINLVALVMLVSVNVLTPFTYAGDEIVENEVENEVENTGESREITEDNVEIAENTTNYPGEFEQENQENNTYVETSPDIQNDVNEQNNELDMGEEKQSLPISDENEVIENQEEGSIGGEKENTDIETGSGIIETGDLLLESLTSPELFLLSGDSLECGSGYVLNADGTGCELIKVTFDANGGSFSGGEETKTVDTIVTELPPIRYSRTENINDNGVASSVYANNLSTNDIVTITGATSLDIEVRFSTESASYDWLAIYPAGITPTASNYSSASISNGKLAGHGNYSNYTKPSDTDATYHRNFTVDGDTAQFYFKSDSSSAYYGYYAIVEGIGAPSGNYRCEYDIPKVTREGYIFQGWYSDEELTQKFDVSQCFLENTTIYAKWYEVNPMDIVLEATSTEANQTLKINKYFANVYTVDRGDGSSENVESDTVHTYAEEGTYIITLASEDRWTFQNVSKPLVPKNGTTTTGVKIVSMPSLADGFGYSVMNPGSYFFKSFNQDGQLTSLPNGSFDTSSITTGVTGFFQSFNQKGQLTSLPEGSFDTSNISGSIGDNFFYAFNSGGQLTNLPEGSFDISNISGRVGNNFFNNFNSNGALTSLPEGSFDTSNIARVGNNFFNNFNSNGALTSLPEGSFDTSNITMEGSDFFSYFNSYGKLTSLPEGSFDTSNITSGQSYFFACFNYNGQLTSLPEGSFDTSNISGEVWRGFFAGFNYNGKLTSLPEGSFDTSNITSVGDSFFSSFNSYGKLTSLPEGSFDTSNITQLIAYQSYIELAGLSFFSHFNSDGALTSLPEGSFRLSTGLTTVGDYFFSSFNAGGQLTSLPEGSFDTSNIARVGDYSFDHFNSYGQLTSLPEGSFDISNIMMVGPYFFSHFNQKGQLTSLPEGSFDISNITTVGSDFFSSFNSYGKLTSLPEGSFDTSNITTVGSDFFSYFNSYGQLTNLPEKSFDISNITKARTNFFSYFNQNGQLITLPNGSFDTSSILGDVGPYFFAYFNQNGQLTTLPEKSFDTSKITSGGNNFFAYFNQNGALTSLPEKSFDIGNITKAGDNFFNYFNSNGKITYLPDSFKLSSAAYNKSSSYYKAFDSTGYILDRNVSDLVSGIIVPSKDRDTFSDNQPGRCGVHENWLVSPAGICDLIVTFNANGGVEIDSKSASSGDIIILPGATKNGYIFLGWYDAETGGNKIGEKGDSFVVDSSQTLYAHWKVDGMIVIQATATAKNQTLKINKYFANAYTVDWGDGSSEDLESDTAHTYSNTGTYMITLSPSGGDRWIFQDINKPLVPINGTSMTGIKILYMPSLADRFGDSETSVGDNFFSHFNSNGALTSLPDGSFVTNKITAVGSKFFDSFNYDGALTNLPDSFEINSVGASTSDGYTNAFNSSNYTLNRNVSDLVAGITVPDSDRNTFSDNQLGRCGVADNWLVNPAGTCGLIVTFDTNGGSIINPISASVGNAILLPTIPKTGYVLVWCDVNGNIVGKAGDLFIVAKSQTLYAKWVKENDIIIEARATSTNQTLKINKYFANAYTVDWGDGSTGTNLTLDTTHKYSKAGTYTITLSLSGADKWTFKSENKPLVPTNGTTMIGVKILYMPSLADGFGNDAIVPGSYFFYAFNSGGKLTSLPKNSFDTSNITRVGPYFFSHFNAGGQLTTLPENSFDTSNITTVRNNFFYAFNSGGKLTSLPENSFNTSNITKIGASFFSYFNYNGQLTSLPENSFDTSNITTVGNDFFSYFNYKGQLRSCPKNSFDTSNITTVGNDFFSYFNWSGRLTTLPNGSFDTSKITLAGNEFFSSFNRYGKLTSLPSGSFDTSKITSAGDHFFYCFNSNGQITSLPENSFDISNITTVGNGFFYYFNQNGQLTTLPNGSFDTSKITSAGASFFSSFNIGGQLTSLPENSFDISNVMRAGSDFFYGFNRGGQITSLPEGSFDTSNITTAGNNFFSSFNQDGQLTSLPEGSFDISNITSVGDSFFYGFNYGGKLTSLPDSFKLTTVIYNDTPFYSPYRATFSSPNYTLNKKVSDIVSGVAIPSADRDTFSDNQPGRCGVHENWLVTTGDACHIIYDTNGWTGTTTGGYAANVTGVTVGSGITIPIREGYFIEGWYTAAESGERIDTVLFPDMDDKTLYIHWGECTEGYTTSHSGTSCVLKKYNVIHNLKGGYFEDDDGNRHEGNQIMTYTYDLAEDTYHNLNPRTIKRENSKFIGWYMQGGEEFNPGNIPAENSMVYAKYECDLGYIENEEGTACEKIRVEFDANGGKFNNGENKNVVNPVIKEGKKDEIRYSHTANINDDGVADSEYENNLSTNDIVTITGATSLDIEVRFATESASYDWLAIYPAGITPTTSNYSSASISNGKLAGHGSYYGYTKPSDTDTTYHRNFTVDGDTVQFYFKSDSSSAYYGYYAIISGKALSEEVAYEDGVFDNIPNPTRNGYKFLGWYYDDQGIEKEFNFEYVTTDRIYKTYAKREKLNSSGGGGGGGGGGGSSSSNTGSATSQTGSQIDSNTGSTASGTNEKEPEGTGDNAEIQTGNQVDSQPDEETSEQLPQNVDKDIQDSTANASEGQQYSEEFQQAYEFAKGRGITTMPTIQKANMNGPLTRIAMAKMLSQYAINVLGQKAENTVVPKFNDVTDKQNSDYDNGVTLAYQLGIMGQNMPNNNFRPTDEVTRAEFATALSRMLYNTSDGEYKSTSKYYTHHMEKLVKEGIITKDNPAMKELRGYVMIMLMRSAEK